MKTTLWLLLVLLSAPLARAQAPRSPTTPVVRKALAEMGRLIQEHAFNHLGTMTMRYPTRIDTVQGLRLYVGEEPSVLGGRAEPDWYCIDFSQPVRPADFTVWVGRGNNFSLVASPQITTRLRAGKSKRKELIVPFIRSQKRRTTDFEPLIARFRYLLAQLPQAPG